MVTKKKPAPAKKRPAKKPVPAKKATTAKRWTIAKKAAPAKPAAAPKPEEQAEEKNPWGESKAKLGAIGEAQVCADIINGTLLADIAKKAGVSSGALLSWLNASQERSARAREARKLGAAVLEEKAQQAIEDADTPFKLQKARELAHHLRWKASKLDPRGFGDKLALGSAQDLPPLPTPPAPNVSVTATFELPPAEAYAQMLARQQA